MKKMSETIVFFGSGPVAGASLELLAKNFKIEAVITKPRPVHHKGDVPVLRVSKSLGLKTHTVSTKAELDELIKSRPFQSRAAVLIDFGIIVSQLAIDSFPLGIINSHFSLLPQWRGADPITFSVLSGQAETGVSLMLLTAGMDEGPILAQSPIAIDGHITTPELTEQLIGLSDAMLSIILPKYLEDEIAPQDQDMSRGLTYSRKLTKEDGLLDWSKDAATLEREVRAYSGWPTSYTEIDGLRLTITSARAIIVPRATNPGKQSIIDRLPAIDCTDNSVLLLEKVKPAGKKEMTGEAFLAGYKSVFIAPN